MLYTNVSTCGVHETSYFKELDAGCNFCFETSTLRKRKREVLEDEEELDDEAYAKEKAKADKDPLPNLAELPEDDTG